jgi:hypothetical protein
MQKIFLFAVNFFKNLTIIFGYKKNNQKNRKMKYKKKQIKKFFAYGLYLFIKKKFTLFFD